MNPAWQGRTDATEGKRSRRWHQLIEALDWKKPDETAEPGPMVFLGFCCDEGVRRNNGRPGASRGPDLLRWTCASLPDHFPAGTRLYDGGDITCENGQLEKAQEELADRLVPLLRAGYRPIVLGGGHEVAYGSFTGLHRAFPGASIGIINIDAHFDLRRPVDGPTSGTPFYQAAHDCDAAGMPFFFFCLGIQQRSNSQALFARASEWEARYLTAEQIRQTHVDGLHAAIGEFMAEVDDVYLSIDLDAFNAAHAPGVSAPNALGLDPRDVVPLIRQIAASGKLAMADIAELNPAFDIDNRTARLGAALIFELLNAWET